MEGKAECSSNLGNHATPTAPWRGRSSLSICAAGAAAVLLLSGCGTTAESTGKTGESTGKTAAASPTRTAIRADETGRRTSSPPKTPDRVTVRAVSRAPRAFQVRTYEPYLADHRLRLAGVRSALAWLRQASRPAKPRPRSEVAAGVAGLRQRLGRLLGDMTRRRLLSELVATQSVFAVMRQRIHAP
jgi:hypothetical protein